MNKLHEVTVNNSEHSVLVSAPNSSKSTEKPEVIFTQAWSAGIRAPYQAERANLLSELTDRVIITPNTPGQGEGSVDLTDEQKEELRAGHAWKLGAFAINMALAVIDEDARTTRKDLLASSQGTLLIPGELRELYSRDIDVPHVIMSTPGSSSSEGPFATARLRANMALLGGIGLNSERSHNPDSLQGLRDTNIFVDPAKNSQLLNHIVRYPHALAHQDLAAELGETIGDHRTSVTILAGEDDRVSKLKENERLHERLVKYGVDSELIAVEGSHTIAENVPNFAKLVKKALDKNKN